MRSPLDSSSSRTACSYQLFASRVNAMSEPCFGRSMVFVLFLTAQVPLTIGFRERENPERSFACRQGNQRKESFLYLSCYGGKPLHCNACRQWVFCRSRTGAMLRRCSLAVAPRFLWECLNSQTVSWFPAPAASNVACGFPALRSPACFESRFMRHLGPEQLSRVLAVSAYSRCIVRACCRSTRYSTVSSRDLCVIWIASDVAGSSFLPSL